MPESAENVATRIRAHFRQAYDTDVEKLVWLGMSDNCGAASNVAPLLGLQTARCYCHIMALAPCHLNFPVQRQQNGESRLVPHENAVAEVYDLLGKCRRLVKQFMRKYGKDTNARELETAQRRLNLNVLICPLDSSSEWSSTYTMLNRLCRMKPGLVEVAATRGGQFPRNCFLTEAEWLVVNQLVGVLRPFKEATDFAQKSCLMGSMVLPIAFTLEHQLRASTAVRCPAGDRGHQHTVPVTASWHLVEEDLLC